MARHCTRAVMVLAITMAVLAPAPLVMANYLVHPDAAAFVDTMVKRGLKREYVERALSRAERQDDVIRLMDRQPEQALTWNEYRELRLTEERIAGGVEFLKANRKTLLGVGRKSGVSVFILTAILGLESNYGNLMGRWRVLDALATLGFDYPRRERFFRAELGNFLVLAKRQGFDPAELMGSYAGAMGMGQFMPSSYLRYAVDQNGDGVEDLFTDRADAIGSVANYLARHGWRRNQSVVVPAEVQGASKEDKSQRAGKVTVTFKPLARLSPKTQVRPMVFVGADGVEYWLSLKNFDVLLRYNNSRLYAMSVWALAREIKARFQ